MIGDISFGYPTGYVVLCLVLGLLYSLTLYWKEKRFDGYNTYLKPLLSIFRWIAVSLIALFLLNPFLKSITEDIQKPTLIIATDQSRSISDNRSIQDSTLLSSIESFTEQWQEKYNIAHINFGSIVSEDLLDTVYTKSTNIAKALSYIRDQYSDRNLSSVVLISDGIFNEGSNPIYNPNLLAIPIHTIGVGDTSLRRDFMIQNILYNNIAYLGDKIQVTVDVKGQNISNTSTILNLYTTQNGQTKKIGAQSINTSSSNHFSSHSFILDVNQPGFIRCKLELNPVAQEQNTKNNYREFFIEVIDARQKILILANSPHPDLAALKNAITSNKNYEVDIQFVSEFSQKIDDYSLLICHNVPGNHPKTQNVIDIIQNSPLPKVFIVGLQSDISLLNTIQKSVIVKANVASSEEIQSEHISSFNAFTTSDEMRKFFKRCPTLLAPFGTYQSQPSAQVFSSQVIKSIKTNYPQLLFNTTSGTKEAVWIGEGIWKWRMFDFLENNTYILTNEFINKIVQYTSVKEDKRKFRIHASKKIYANNEPVVLDAQLYNDNFELVNTAEVKVKIKDDAQNEFTFIMSKNDNFYTLYADLFPVGSYEVTAEAIVDGVPLIAKTTFNVERIELESLIVTADHGLLRAISANSGGYFYTSDKVMNLIKDIQESSDAKPILYSTEKTNPLLNNKWLLGFIIFLLSIEWFLRRYSGHY